MTTYMPALYSMIGHSASLTGKTAWQYVRWDIVLRRVKSLQRRIVKAVRAIIANGWSPNMMIMDDL